MVLLGFIFDNPLLHSQRFTAHVRFRVPNIFGDTGSARQLIHVLRAIKSYHTSPAVTWRPSQLLANRNQDVKIWTNRNQGFGQTWPNWPPGQHFHVHVTPTGVTQNTLSIVHIVIDNYSVISMMIVICQSMVSCEDNVMGMTVPINHTQVHISKDTM